MRLRLTLALLGAFFGLGGVARAESVIVGPPEIDTTPEIFGEGSGSDATTFVNVRIPLGRARSPVNGTITKWHVNIYDTFGDVSGFRLQVVRRTRNKPGFAGDVYEAVAQTPPVTVSQGENVFEVSRPIRKGDFIGLRYPAASAGVAGLDHGRFLDFEPPLTPGGPGDKMIGERGLDRHLLLNATVRK